MAGVPGQIVKERGEPIAVIKQLMPDIYILAVQKRAVKLKKLQGGHGGEKQGASCMSARI
jgi:hypothetical protein